MKTITWIFRKDEENPPEFSEITFRVGDSSGSESERWVMLIQQKKEDGQDGRLIRFASKNFGQVEERAFKLANEGSYEITLEHQDTSEEQQEKGFPDYDWEAQVEGKFTEPVLTEDGAFTFKKEDQQWLVVNGSNENESGLLGVHEGSGNGGNETKIDKTIGRKSYLLPVEVEEVIEPEESAECTGYDKDENALMVPMEGSNKIKVKIAGASADLLAKMKFVAEPADKLTIVPQVPTAAEQELTLSGTAAALGVKVQLEIDGTKVDLFEADVLKRKELKVSFHYITDKDGTKTSRNIGDEVAMMKKVNAIWNSQANVFFSSKKVVQSTVPIDLGNVVRFSAHLNGVPANEHEWDDVIALGDIGADVKVFFVWEYEQDDTPSVDGTDAAHLGGDVLFEDNAGVEIGETLAHEFGHFLEIEPSDYMDREEELMHGISDLRDCRVIRSQWRQANN